MKVWAQADGDTNHYISNMSITMRYRTPFEYAGQTPSYFLKPIIFLTQQRKIRTDIIANKSSNNFLQ